MTNQDPSNINDMRTLSNADSPSPDPSCSTCGGAHDTGAKFCPQCGRDLAPLGGSSRKPTSPEEAREAKPDRTPELREVESAPKIPMVCRSTTASKMCICGERLAPNARFCHICGSPVDAAVARYHLVKRTGKLRSVPTTLSGSELTIGNSAECDVMIPEDEFTSRRHARVFRSNGMLFLEDLGSSNGTFLRVHRPVAMEDGDELVIGTTVFMLEDRQSCLG